MWLSIELLEKQSIFGITLHCGKFLETHRKTHINLLVVE
jgi:hypothetical protein